MKRKLLVTALVAGFVAALLPTLNFKTRAQEKPTVVLQGNLNKVKLKRKKNYVLVGGVFIKKKLIIQSGTQIFGSLGSFIVIDKGATIEANGTREQPIVFTSAAPDGRKKRGDWGGLIFNGDAPINVPGGTAQGEGGTGAYGGNNASDSSGFMRFVRVEYGGFALSPENELNCIAFQGVGSETDIDFIQSAFGGDDGIEMFGGTVGFKHAVVVGAGDDSFDWTFGWSGNAQFLVAQQRADEADRGFEADNNNTNNNLEPRSDPRITNVTLVGDPGAGNGSTQGMLLREGTAGQIRNAIVMGFKNFGIRVDQEATFTQLNSGNLQLRSIILFNNGTTQNNTNIATGATAAAVAANGQKIMESDPLLINPFSKTSPDFRPSSGSPALNPANVEPVFNDPFFSPANFVGAFDGNEDWTLGWVNWIFGN